MPIQFSIPITILHNLYLSVKSLLYRAIIDYCIYNAGYGRIKQCLQFRYFCVTIYTYCGQCVAGQTIGGFRSDEAALPECAAEFLTLEFYYR